MATKRLDLSEKDKITSSVSEIMNRVIYGLDFPIEHNSKTQNRTEFVWDLLPQDMRNAYFVIARYTHPETYQKSVRVALERDMYSRSDVTVKLMDGDTEYRVNMPLENCIPSVGEYNFELPTSHERYDDFIQWTHTYLRHYGHIQTADDHLTDIVNNCSAAGQIARVLPDLKDYLGGEARESLTGAVRRSRLPPRLEVDREAVKHIMHYLAMGSLIPEADWSKKRHYPTASRITKLEKE